MLHNFMIRDIVYIKVQGQIKKHLLDGIVLTAQIKELTKYVLDDRKFKMLKKGLMTLMKNVETLGYVTSKSLNIYV